MEKYTRKKTTTPSVLPRELLQKNQGDYGTAQHWINSVKAAAGSSAEDRSEQRQANSYLPP